jgi:DnaK suppressor protein
MQDEHRRTDVDEQKARELLQAERARVEDLLGQRNAAGAEDRAGAAQTGDWVDRSEPITEEEIDGAVAASLRDRLTAIERAEKRLEDGTYGRSTLSGTAIPDERLEADPAAELTVEEASRAV